MAYQLKRLARHDKEMEIQEMIDVVVDMNGGDRTKALYFLMSLLITSDRSDNLTETIANYQLDMLSY